MVGEIPITAYAQGDDSADNAVVTNKAEIPESIILAQLMSDAMDLKLKISKVFTSMPVEAQRTTEFLRKIITPSGCHGYPGRLIPTLCEAAPVASEFVSTAERVEAVMTRLGS